MVTVSLIEEFTDEKKFADRVKTHLENTGTHDIHYAVTHSGKGFLYSALIITT